MLIMYITDIFSVVLFISCGSPSFAGSLINDPALLREVNCDDSMDNKLTKDNIKKLYKKFTQRYTGRVTYFGDYPYGITTCMLDPLPPMQQNVEIIPAAVSYKEYIDSFACGSCLKLTPRSEVLKRQNVSVNDFVKTYFATVVDICHHCKPGEMKLYKNGEGFHDVIYEGTPCKQIDGIDGSLMMKFSSCKNDDKRMKVQMKNMKIPVAQVELFHDQKWSCLKRGKNNYYLLDDLQNTTFPIEGRLTAVDGQVLGFSLEQNVVKDKNEVFLPTQFNSFHLDKLDRIPNLKCYDGNNTLKKTNTSSGTNKSKDDSLKNNTLVTEQNIMSDFVNSTTKTPTGFNADRNKNDTVSKTQKNCEELIRSGFYGNCDKYISCYNGKATVKSCPRGFLYDADKMRCTRNSSCLDGTLKKSSEEEDIYTRRFY